MAKKKRGRPPKKKVEVKSMDDVVEEMGKTLDKKKLPEELSSTSSDEAVIFKDESDLEGDGAESLPEIQPEPKEKPENKEKDVSDCRPKGAPDAHDCTGEYHNKTYYIYKIKPEKVAKYKGRKKILIEK